MRTLNRQDAKASPFARYRKFGLNPAEILRAAFADDTAGYLEFHIEQVPSWSRWTRLRVERPSWVRLAWSSCF